MNAKLQGTKIFWGFAHLKCCLVNKKNVIAAKNLTFRQKERMMGDVGFWDNEDQKKNLINTTNKAQHKQNTT